MKLFYKIKTEETNGTNVTLTYADFPTKFTWLKKLEIENINTTVNKLGSGGNTSNVRNFTWGCILPQITSELRTF